MDCVLTKKEMFILDDYLFPVILFYLDNIFSCDFAIILISRDLYFDYIFSCDFEIILISRD